MRYAELVLLGSLFLVAAVAGIFFPAVWVLDALLFLLTMWNDPVNLLSWNKRLAFMSTLAESRLLLLAFVGVEIACFPITYAGYCVTGLAAAREEHRLESACKIALLEAQVGFTPPYEEKACTHCGSVERFTGAYCPRCGSSQEPQRDRPALTVCARCASANFADAAYCSRCGATLPATDT